MNGMYEPDRVVLQAFLDEDLADGDVTSQALVPEAAQARGLVRAQERATVAGVAEACALADLMGVEPAAQAVDGDLVDAGNVVMELDGPARAILAVERTLLNLLSHMSGVATVTRRATDIVTTSHTGGHAERPPRVSATRKTTPGMRDLQKRAVVLGGGLPHRRNLGDAVLVKDNHLAIEADLPTVIARLRKQLGSTTLEIEVETLQDALLGAESGADILLLDNFAPAGIVEAVTALKAQGLRQAVLLEASGGITLDTIADFADTGVDMISLGILTSAPPHIDFSLHFDV